MYPSIRQRRVKHKKGDLVVDSITKIRKCYDGNKWRRLCSVQQCNKKAQIQGVCMRHSRIYQISSRDDQNIQLVQQNFTDKSFKSKFHQHDFHNQSFDNDSKEHLVLPNTISTLNQTEFANQMNFNSSSMPIISTDVFSDVLMNSDDKQTNKMDMKICEYSTLSNSAIPCRNLGHYKCSHCSFSFCLEHDLQHQQELKDEICNLLNEAKGMYKNIDRLSMNSGSWLCSICIDQWATKMHTKIDQTRAQLQMKLNILDGQIEANKDRWKTSLQTDVETKVGCVLMELLQKYEIDGLKLNKAHQDLVSLKTIFNTLNHEQLITIMNYEEEKINFNSPQLNYPSILLNETYCTRNLSSESSEDNNNSFNDSSHQMNSYNQFNGYLNTNYQSIENSEVIDSAMRKVSMPGKLFNVMSTASPETVANSTDNIINGHQRMQENFLVNPLESDLLTNFESSKKFENGSPHSIEDSKMFAVDTETSGLQSSSLCMSTATMSNDDIFNGVMDQGIDPAALHHTAENNKLLPISMNLDLSNSEIGDKEVFYLIESFQNNDMPTTLNLACNHIGRQGALSLSNILQNNKRLTTLILQSNCIGSQGLEYLSATLRDNTTLTTLDLSCNQIDDDGIRYLCNALAVNKTLTTLNLERNQIGEEGARYLSEILQSNTTLTTLQLRWNCLGENGTQYLSNALQYNNTLIELNLSYNQIGNTGARYLSEALKYNTKLRKLELRCNQIDDEGIQNLCQTLSNNQTLSVLNLLGNEIGVRGAEYLIGLRDRNTRLRVHRK